MVSLTENAIERIKNYQIGNEKYKDKKLRIFIQGGGCSGYQYGFAFDEKRDGDNIIETTNKEISVLIDEESASLLKGSTIDFVDSLSGAGFTVDNPNASSTCGCGTSFNCSTC